MATLKPTEAELDWYGGLIAGSQFGGATLGVALLAIQFFMVLFGISIYVSTPIGMRKGRLRFVVISCVILVASGSDTLSDVWTSFRVLYTGGPTGRSYTTSYNNVYVYEEDQRLRIAGNVMLFITIAVGDALLLWRCMILWNDRKWITIPPFLTAIGAIVLYGVAIPPYGYTNRPRVRAIIASAALGVATNVMVTSLIVLRLALTWFTVRKSFPDKEDPPVYTRIAAILIESAAPLTFFGICFITTTAVNYLRPPTTITSAGTSLVLSSMFDWLYYSFCALSPQMIIFRVATSNTWRNSSESKGGMGTFSQPMQFAQDASNTRGSILTDSNN